MFSRKILPPLGMMIAVLFSAPAQAGWIQATSPHFVVYSDGGQKQLADFAEDLERYDNLLRVTTGATGEDHSAPVHVYLIRSDGQVQSLASTKNIGGYYSVGPRYGYALASRETASSRFDLDGRQILFHEYAHHFMLHYFPAAYPVWYVEGFAEYYETAEFAKEGTISLGRIPMARAPDLVMLPLFPFKDLFARDNEKFSREEGARFYAAAWLLTHFMHFRPDRSAELERYLKDLAAGKPGMVADSYFAGGLEGLQKDVQAYMKKPIKYQMMALKTPPAVHVTISAVPEAEGALIPYQIRLLRHMPKEQRAAFAGEVREAAAKYSDSAYAWALEADAERLAGNEDAALAAADRAIALDPRFARPLATRADILLDRAEKSDRDEDWKAALTTIVHANRADLEDPVPLELFYRYNARHGGKMPDVAYDGLWKAYALLPQSPEVRFMLASALARRKDYDRAAQILAPLAFSPHAGGTQSEAERMRGAILAAKTTQDQVTITEAAADDGDDDGD